MKRMISGIVAWLLVLCVMLDMPVNAKDNVDDDLIKFTEADAVEAAEIFVKNNCIDGEIVGMNPIKFYNKENRPIGYIIEIYNENILYGYVIFDSTCEGLISEYSIGENVKSPYANALEESEISSYALRETKVYKLDALTYGIYDTDKDDIETNTGESIEAESIIPRESARSGATHEWDDIFINKDSISLYYILEAANYTDIFCAFTESYVENMTGKYACGVSAMGACADYFGVWDWSDFAGDYQRLWDLSGTYAIKNENGIIYGSTSYYNIGPAFKTFCAENGLSISVNATYAPTYSFFKNCIDNGGIGVFGCNINTTSGNLGHIMAMEGYYQYISKETNTRLHLLKVADGWGTSPRYVNFDFSDYTYVAGVSFVE